MAPSARDRISVDLHGLKSALVARARTQRVGVSAVVRRVVERELGLGGTVGEGAASGAAGHAHATVKLSLRLTLAEAEQFAAGARRAGLSRGAFLAGLLADIPSLSGDGGPRLDCMKALTASNAELATLSRNVSHLTALLRQGDVRAAQQYRRMFDTLGDEVRAHLRLAASVLAELRPARRTLTGRVSARHPAA